MSRDELVALTIHQMLSSLEPRQAEVLRRVAIPQWVDVHLLSVLRESIEGNERALEILRHYSFVHNFGDGRIRYHQEVRNAIIEEWRRERPNELRDIHWKIYDHIKSRLKDRGNGGFEHDALYIAMIYHLGWLNEEEYIAVIVDFCRNLEDTSGLGVAEAILISAMDLPLGPRGKRWVLLSKAYVNIVGGNLDASLDQVSAIVGRGDFERGMVNELFAILVKLNLNYDSIEKKKATLREMAALRQHGTRA